MRLWSLHPRYLDRQGLTACWREALLAQAVLAGRTRGYTRHPQLERFRAQPDPIAALGDYLTEIVAEADRRGHRYDRTKIIRTPGSTMIEVTGGQLAFERDHLQAKLRRRSPQLPPLPATPEAHPLFVVIPGGPAAWERAIDTASET